MRNRLRDLQEKEENAKENQTSVTGILFGIGIFSMMFIMILGIVLSVLSDV